MNTPLERLRAARQATADMLARNTDPHDMSILLTQIAALDKQIVLLSKASK